MALASATRASKVVVGQFANAACTKGVFWRGVYLELKLLAPLVE